MIDSYRQINDTFNSIGEEGPSFGPFRGNKIEGAAERSSGLRKRTRNAVYSIFPGIEEESDFCEDMNRDWGDGMEDGLAPALGLRKRKDFTVFENDWFRGRDKDMEEAQFAASNGLADVYIEEKADGLEYTERSAADEYEAYQIESDAEKILADFDEEAPAPRKGIFSRVVEKYEDYAEKRMDAKAEDPAPRKNVFGRMGGFFKKTVESVKDTLVTGLKNTTRVLAAAGAALALSSVGVKDGQIRTGNAEAQAVPVALATDTGEDGVAEVSETYSPLPKIGPIPGWGLKKPVLESYKITNWVQSDNGYGQALNGFYEREGYGFELPKIEKFQMAPVQVSHAEHKGLGLLHVLEKHCSQINQAFDQNPEYREVLYAALSKQMAAKRLPTNLLFIGSQVSIENGSVMVRYGNGLHYEFVLPQVK